MKTLALHEMEKIEGGSCGAAIAVGVISGAAIIATAIWASPKTWYGASVLVANSSYWIYDQCN